MTENSSQSAPQTYQSLADIRARKQQIRKAMNADDAKIKNLWKSIFTKPDIMDPHASAGRKISSALSLGAGALDGALLAWKLYRKFKR